MKKVFRMVIVMLGLATAYVALAAPVMPTSDGGPIPLCRPSQGPCSYD